MKFTDEDLQHLKDDLGKIGAETFVPVNVELFKALIARLEAAEDVASHAVAPVTMVNTWREAAGRETV